MNCHTVGCSGYPINRELRKRGYFEKFAEVYFPSTDNSMDVIYGRWGGGYIMLPQGITGEELWSLRKSLSAEYKIIERNHEDEVIRRGAQAV